MIRHKIRTDPVALRRIHESAMAGHDTLSVNPVDETIRLLNQLPRIDSMVYNSLDLVARLNPDDVTRVVRQLKATNPGIVNVIKELGYWFPPDDKHHVRHAFVCFASAVAAGSAPIKLHRLE
ncbi:TPA: hypothetical protein DIV45_00445 [Patescibacteria group bacterium]|nr:hypothetical protein [Patescibacteria group bacterium]